MHTPAMLSPGALARLLLAAILALRATLAAAQPPPASVEVVLRSSTTVALDGVTHAIALHDTICSVTIGPSGLTIDGVARGETVVFVWTGDRRVDILVRVTAPPRPPVPTTIPERQRQHMGQGRLSSSAQITTERGGRQTWFFQHLLDWSRQTEGRRTDLRLQVRDTSTPGIPVNIESASFRHVMHSATLTLLDFDLELNGGENARVASHSPLSVFGLRGTRLAFEKHDTRVEAFAGTSRPWQIGSLAGTERVAGVSVGRQHSTALYLFSTAAVVRTPAATAAGGAGAKRSSGFATGGMAYRQGDRWGLQATGGGSPGGLYGNGTLAFEHEALAIVVAAAGTAPAFPLTQLQVLGGGGTTVRGNIAWRGSGRLSAALFYQHSHVRASPLGAALAGASDYLNPHASLTLSRAHSLTINGVLSRSEGPSDDGTSKARTLDIGWTSHWGDRLVNSMQVSALRSGRHATFDTDTRMSVGNTTTLRLGRGAVNASLRHTVRDPSLVTRLRQQIGLLPTDLQGLFLTNPAAFLHSSALPDDVRTTLESLRDDDSQFSVGGHMRVGSRVDLSANYSRLRSAQAGSRSGRSSVLGYVASLRLSESLQLRSSLSDAYFLDASSGGVSRASAFLVGITRSRLGLPPWLAPLTNRHVLDGLVFVDEDVSGRHSPGEPGLAGVPVRLDDGQTAVTDPDGRFRFEGLGPRIYGVTVDLDRVSGRVRATTLTTASVDLVERSRGSVSFGVVNFARLTGSVYNDVALGGQRRADAPGLQGVTVIVTDGSAVTRHVVTDGAGQYRIDDLPPGRYEITVDHASLPPGFTQPIAPPPVEVQAIRTAVVDLAARAMRSVAGHVYLRDIAGATPVMIPAAGVTVVAAGQTSTTDAQGRFLLRDLPAGEVAVSILTRGPLPPGMAAPSGLLRLPVGPVHVGDALIVIGNRALAAALGME